MKKKNRNRNRTRTRNRNKTSPRRMRKKKSIATKKRNQRKQIIESNKNNQLIYSSLASEANINDVLNVRFLKKHEKDTLEAFHTRLNLFKNNYIITYDLNNVTRQTIDNIKNICLSTNHVFIVLNKQNVRKSIIVETINKSSDKICIQDIIKIIFNNRPSIQHLKLLSIMVFEPGYTIIVPQSISVFNKKNALR